MRGPQTDTLPAGFGVRLSSRARVCDAGRTLVGGTAGKVLYLAPAATRLVSTGRFAVADDPAAGPLARLLLDRGFADPDWSEPPGPDEAVTDVTVVVPVRDRPGPLARLLGALPDGLAVVVVDDGSRDRGTVASVAGEYDARLVTHGRNLGPAAARNTGLRQVATPYVAFCDSDVVPDPGWLATLRRHLDDPALAVAAPRIRGPVSRPGDSWVERYEQARSSLDLGPGPAAVRLHGAVSYLPAACLVARVDALDDGFDERMQVGEDVDLVWRLLEAGWRVRYEPAAVVRHAHRTRPAEWLRRKAFYGTSAAPLAARHADAVAPAVLSPWSVVFVGALLAQRWWSPPVALAAAGVATVVTSRKLGRSEHPVRAAAVLTAEGTVASLGQGAALLTRHYWPLALLAAVGSRRARRALLVAAVAEGLADHRRTRPDLDPVRYLVARRLDDLAYGAGLWWGAARAGSMRALTPHRSGSFARWSSRASASEPVSRPAARFPAAATTAAIRWHQWSRGDR